MSAATLEHPMVGYGQPLEVNIEGISLDFERALDLARMQRVFHRQDHEPANLEKLSLSEEARAQYSEMIAQPERAGQLIAWMGAHATTAYQALEAGTAPKILTANPAKIVLEIGGKLQHGSWEHTTELDDMARSIPRQLDAVDPRIGIQVYYGARDKRTRYRVLPLWAGGTFKHAVLRRRLITADVYIPDCLPVELYKECSTVVDVDALAEITASIGQPLDIASEFSRNREYAGKSNSRLAKRTGAFLEDAIHGNEELQTGILPVGSHHMMAVRRSDTVPSRTH